jgi:limonene-1,2-epoxide hydrolase
MTPKQLITQWVETFNRGDADALAALYTADAVNHQVANEPVEGRTAIHAMFARDFASVAASGNTMHCIPENIFADGDWGILEWRDPTGLCGCGFFRFTGDKIAFQRGYWDKLSFLRLYGLPLPTE